MRRRRRRAAAAAELLPRGARRERDATVTPAVTRTGDATQGSDAAAEDGAPREERRADEDGAKDEAKTRILPPTDDVSARGGAVAADVRDGGPVSSEAVALRAALEAQLRSAAANATAAESSMRLLLATLTAEYEARADVARQEITALRTLAERSASGSSHVTVRRRRGHHDDSSEGGNMPAALAAAETRAADAEARAADAEERIAQAETLAQDAEQRCTEIERESLIFLVRACRLRAPRTPHLELSAWSLVRHPG